MITEHDRTNGHIDRVVELIRNDFAAGFTAQQIARRQRLSLADVKIALVGVCPPRRTGYQPTRKGGMVK